MMQRYAALRVLALAWAFANLTTLANAEAITGAHYASPVDRYGHFALGRPHEYARLIVVTDTGRSVGFDLPADEVFEDLAPRWMPHRAGQPHEVLTIVSQRDSGSRLALFQLKADRLERSADSSPIGTPNRWLNPVGVVDVDADGHYEVAAVTTPHIGGTLKIYRRSGNKLIETAALADFSNHIFGQSEQSLSAVVFASGQLRMLVPDSARNWLRVIAWEGGGLKEVGRCGMPAKVTGPILVVSNTAVVVGTATGQQRFVVSECKP